MTVIEKREEETSRLVKARINFPKSEVANQGSPSSPKSIYYNESHYDSEWESLNIV